MAKASMPGLTKTRLVPPLTYRRGRRLQHRIPEGRRRQHHCGGAGNAAIAGYLAFGPPGSEQFFRDNLAPPIGLIEAWRPDFGDCLFTAIDRMLHRPRRRRGAQFRQPDVADLAPGRDRADAGAGPAIAP